MRTNPHLRFETLADMAEGRLSVKEQAESSTHIAGCPRCALELDRLKHVVSLMKTDSAEEVPRDLTAYANSIFNARSRAVKGSMVRRIVAMLSFDSLTAAPDFGVRSGQTAARQLIFSAEENDLDLRLVPDDGMWLVSGQIMTQECADGEVHLQGESDSKSVRLNELCEFTFPSIPPGTYKLRLRLSDIEIEIPQLELSS